MCTDRLVEAGDTPLVSVVKFQIARAKTRTTDGVVASVRFGEKLLSLAAAVAAAERQLSQPLTPEMFCAVREELALSSEQSFEEAKKRYACVGACLHGAIYLGGGEPRPRNEGRAVLRASEGEKGARTHDNTQ